MTFRRLLFAILDFLIPEHPRLTRLRGNIARLTLGLHPAQGLQLERGVDFSLAPMLIVVGNNCEIQRGCVFHAHDKYVTLGDNVLLAQGVRIYSYAGASVTIGSHVQIGTSTIIFTGSHEVGDRMRRAGTSTSHSITIGDGTWIGLRCTIHRNIGAGCIIDSSSTVFKDVLDDTHCGGNPARQISKLSVPEPLSESVSAPIPERSIS
jgi:maltose O-acetyltransferase